MLARHPRSARGCAHQIHPRRRQLTSFTLPCPGRILQDGGCTASWPAFASIARFRGLNRVSLLASRFCLDSFLGTLGSKQRLAEEAFLEGAPYFYVSLSSKPTAYIEPTVAVLTRKPSRRAPVSLALARVSSSFEVPTPASRPLRLSCEGRAGQVPFRRHGTHVTKWRVKILVREKSISSPYYRQLKRN